MVKYVTKNKNKTNKDRCYHSNTKNAKLHL